jgi:hypothetical protein
MVDGTPTTTDLPPEVALAMRLEGIFMPRARAQRDELFAKSKRFVHYTSAENALKSLGLRDFGCEIPLA